MEKGLPMAACAVITIDQMGEFPSTGESGVFFAAGAPELWWLVPVPFSAEWAAASMFHQQAVCRHRTTIFTTGRNTLD